MISFKHVSKHYGNVKALDDLSFDIDAGEFVFIVGPSGAGKTTIRKLLIKELTPTAGDIAIGDFELGNVKRNEVPTLRRQIGIVFQNYQLLPDRTAAENIALALEIANKNDQTIRSTVKRLLELVGLPDKGLLFPSQLSGGEAQRIVIARALATDPAVLFADEPTGNLDRDNALHIVKLLQKIHQHGTTIIMATHDTDLIKSIPARIITLDQGRLVSDSGSTSAASKPTASSTKAAPDKNATN